VSGDLEGFTGNRDVSPPEILGTRGNFNGAGLEAKIGERGGSCGKHGFPHPSEAKPSEVAA